MKHGFEYWCFPAWLADEIRERYPGLTVVHLPDYSRLAAEIADADILLGYSLRPEQFARATKLKWIHATAAAVHQLLHEGIRDSDVQITNSSSILTVPIAEHAIGLILALARHFPSAVRYQERRQWAQTEIWRERPSPMEINGRTLLIVGYGAIGQELGRRAKALGMRVVGIKRDTSQGREHADEIHTPDQLPELLPRADFVVLATPVTSVTHHGFSHEQFAAMKQAAYFVNIGRGELADSAALTDALKQKQIAGAAIDVTEQEPLPPDDPLWTAPGMLVTPHLAAVSDQLWQRQRALIFENMDRWFAGRPLLNLIDKQRGY